MKLTPSEKHRNKVERIANRLAALSPQNRINDVAKVFQRLVRIEHADKHGNCKCVTCGKVLPWNDSAMNAGHFISRSKHATVFHFVNCHPQCASCNDPKRRGNKSAEYERYMIATYGSDVVSDLLICSEQKLKWTCEELAEKKIQLLLMEKEAMQKLSRTTTEKPATENGLKKR